MITIDIDGVRLGALDPDTLTMGDVIDLEEAKGFRDIAAWLVEKAGADMTDVRKLPYRKLTELAEGLRDALKTASELPN
jgi:hypothetical protein